MGRALLALALLVACTPARPPLPDAVTPVARLERRVNAIGRLPAAALAGAARRLEAADVALATAETPAQRRRARIEWMEARAELRAALKP